MGNVGHNENLGKGLIQANIELEHPLAVGFNARLVYSLERETIDEPLSTGRGRRNGADIGTTIDHEGLARTTLMDEEHAAS